MKNKINKYFFKEFASYFGIVLFALVAIIWIGQAVNFLDLVVEDGHAFSVYFAYSFLNIPKIITKILPFCFLASLILTIYKFERENELIVLWTSGLNKIKIVNLIFTLSLIVTIVHFILASSITPRALNLSRTLIKNSDLYFLPALIKEKEFNDTIQGVTIFVEKKNNDGTIGNVLIRDSNKILQDATQKSSTIFAKKGIMKQNYGARHLLLFNGSIQKEKKDGTINFIKFEKIILSLENISTRSIIMPKVQETSSYRLLNCTFNYNFLSNIKLTKFKSEKKLRDDHNCSKENKSLIIELNRRFGMPFYIPVLALIGSFLLSSKRDNKISIFHNFNYGMIGFFILIFAEIFVRYSGKILYSYLYYSIPMLMIPIIYLILLKTFKYENLK